MGIGWLGRVISLVNSIERDAKLLIWARALRSFIGGLVSVIFTIYLSLLGASPLVMGLLFTVTAFFSAVRSLIEGMLADRFGRKPFLLLLSGLLTASGVIYATTCNLTVLLCTTALGGLGSEYLVSPSEQAMLSEKTTDRGRTTLFSVASFTSTLSSMVGAFSAGAPQLFQTSFGSDEIQSYQPVFILVALVSFMSLLLVIPLREERWKEASEKPELEVVEEEGRYEETRKILGKFAIVVAFDSLGGTFTGRFLSYWLYTRFGAETGKIGTLFGASNLLSAFSYILGLKLARRVGTVNATVLSRLPVVGVNLILPFVPTYDFAAFLQGFRSLFSMIDVPLRQSYLMGITRRDRRASVAGASGTAMMVASTVAPTLSGYLFQYVSAMFSFLFGGLFQLASATLLWAFFKDIKPPEERR